MLQLEQDSRTGIIRAQLKSLTFPPMANGTTTRLRLSAHRRDALKGAAQSSREQAAAPTVEAYHMLHVGYSLLAGTAGLDKFFGVLGNWEAYLAPFFPFLLNISSGGFLRGVGILEIGLSVLTAVRPKIGAYFVAFWLWAVVLNFLMLGQFYDIALRDVGLSIGALALARLSHDIPAKAVMTKPRFKQT